MPAWRGPAQGTSSDASASSPSSSREAPKAPAATAAPPAAPWTKRLRETPLTSTPLLGLDAEGPLHAGERLGQRLHRLLHRALLGLGELVVGRVSRTLAELADLVEGGRKGVVDVVRE